MILTTHAVIGGALASVSRANPYSALVLGFLSHYLLDSLPHWDYFYSLRSNVRVEAGNSLEGDIVIGRGFLYDLFKLVPDLLLGVFLALHFFSTGDFSTWPGAIKGVSDPILWGALGAILPDLLQFLYYKVRREPFVSLQKFHALMHTTKRWGEERNIIGPAIQIVLILLAIILFRR